MVGPLLVAVSTEPESWYCVFQLLPHIRSFAQFELYRNSASSALSQVQKSSSAVAPGKKARLSSNGQDNWQGPRCNRRLTFATQPKHCRSWCQLNNTSHCPLKVEGRCRFAPNDPGMQGMRRETKIGFSPQRQERTEGQSMPSDKPVRMPAASWRSPYPVLLALDKRVRKESARQEYEKSSTKLAHPVCDGQLFHPTPRRERKRATQASDANKATSSRTAAR
eukprot:1837139-Pleurochrysis_carterae.AAC.1